MHRLKRLLKRLFLALKTFSASHFRNTLINVNVNSPFWIDISYIIWLFNENASMKHK